MGGMVKCLEVSETESISAERKSKTKGKLRTENCLFTKNEFMHFNVSLIAFDEWKTPLRSEQKLSYSSSPGYNYERRNT
jgi:hypothetical protein